MKAARVRDAADVRKLSVFKTDLHLLDAHVRGVHFHGFADGPGTGARLQNTMLNSVKWHDKSTGLITMCVGGGQGMAMILERLG